MTRRTVLTLPAIPALALSAAPEICGLTAIELSRRLRAKQLSAREVLDAYLQQIDRVNPKVNAIVTLVAGRAREQARRLDDAAARGQFAGPLHGLPTAHKDLVETKGIRTTFGSPIYKDNVPERDALLVERIRAAGAVLVGKTNTPEFGAGSQTFNPVFGATHNPYDLTRTCGGSSGGAATALATNMLPIADGSDMGGSLRNPASFCGIVGFRPSPGRVPRVPTSNAWNTLSVLGPMARNVPDLALFFSAMAGPDQRDPLSIHEPGSRFARPLDRDWKGIRIAWAPGLKGVPFDRRVVAVMNSQRKTFQSLGCAVEEAQPDFSGADEAFRVFRAQSFHHQYGSLLAAHRAQMKATVIEEVERGARLTTTELASAERQRSQVFARVGDFLQKYEYFILPTVQVPPFDINHPYVTEIEGVKFSSYIDWMRSCFYITVTSLPAISVPAGFTPEGLPVGIQIVGRHQADWSVLQLANAFEQAAKIKTGNKRMVPELL